MGQRGIVGDIILELSNYQRYLMNRYISYNPLSYMEQLGFLGQRGRN